MRLPAAVTALVLLVACSHAPPVQEPVSSGAMPLRVEDARLLLPVSLPGDLSTWFLFDTGSGDYSVIDVQLSRALGLEHELAREESVLGVHSTLPWVEIGAQGARDFRVYVEDFATLNHLEGLSATGVVGPSWFQGQRLLLSSARQSFDDAARLPRPGGPGSVALRWGSQGTLLLTVQVQGRSANAVLDTGARRSLLAPALAETLGGVLPPVDAESPAVLESAEVSIGGRSVILPALEVASELRDTLGLDLVLGMDVLGRFDLGLDLGDEPRLWLIPPSDPPTLVGDDR